MTRREQPSLWSVHYGNYYYNEDDVKITVSERFYVVAHDHEEAIGRTQGLIDEANLTYKRLGAFGGKGIATRVALGDLIVVRDVSEDGGSGRNSGIKCDPVRFSLEEDATDYRIEVRIVPVRKRRK